MDRVTRLLGSARPSDRILELGAGYTPVAPKAAGWRTHVVDHATQDELKAKYSGDGIAVNLTSIDTSRIEHVDTVWYSGPLHEALPPGLAGHVDLIIASHVLEHIPDLLGFFQSASRLVHPDGAISVALPDRRYCFDCFKPWSTTGDMLDAHHRLLERHSLKTAFNHMAYSASADGQLGWRRSHFNIPDLMDPFATAARLVAEFNDRAGQGYNDYHAWQFTPAGFQLIMLELTELGVTDWAVDDLHASDSFEFFVRLRRRTRTAVDITELQALRRQFLITQLVEAREQIDLMLGPATAANPDTESATPTTYSARRRLPAVLRQFLRQQ